MGIQYTENVGIAFGIVIAAGLSTAVGSAVVFFPSMVKYANRKTLASGLGLSSGVMTYVSFNEIFQKSVDSFMEAEFLEHQAYLSATLCFFAGIIFMVCLNLIIHGVASHNLITKGQYGESAFEDSDEESILQEEESEIDEKERKGSDQHKKKELGSDLPDPCACGEDAVSRLEGVQAMAEAINEEESKTLEETGEDLSDDIESGSKANGESKEGKKRKRKKKSSRKAKKKLMLMSMNTAAAICLHNFPEGLATFVATLHDPAVGAVLAIAIALHNIPEGLCVSMPVFYATGDRRKAFTWGLVSGLSEPVAALFGWLVLATWMNAIVFAVLFGVVSGMMVVISIKELLPTAHRYDPEDSVVSNCFILGMALMAFSLVLFAQIA